MNKTYSKKELEAKALEVFEQHPNQDKVYAREDGNVFFSENYAELDKGELKIFPIEREVKAEVPAAATTKATTTKATAPKAAAPKAAAKKAVTPKDVKDIKVTAETVIPNATLGKDGKNPENRQSQSEK
jgi:hypothetical protein